MAAPDLDAVKDYLGSGSSWTDEQVAQALAAETAAQARVCKIPDLAPLENWPADLAEALKRRVARNLEARGLPLGIQVTDMGGMRLGYDYEIRRLEAPYRRLVIG